MADKDILVVQSKVKTYIKESSGMNTSGNVAPRLSQLVKQLCQQAMQNAQKDGRKTVMDRDFPSLGE